MIRDPQRIRVPVVTQGEMDVITNWNNQIKGNYLKIRVNGEEVIVPRSSFSKVAMVLANEEEQEAMIPVKSVPIHELKKIVTLKLTRDMKAGQMLTVPVEMKVPRSAFKDPDGLVPIII